MYGDNKGWSQAPGYGPKTTSEDREILYRPNHVEFDEVWIQKDTVDNENTGKTSGLRPGLVLVPGTGASAGMYVNPEHADATAAASLVVNDVVILGEFRETKDQSGTVQHITAKVIRHAFVIAENVLYGSGTSSPNKVLIRAAAPQIGFISGHQPT
jgi:hypothetical protein